MFIRDVTDRSTLAGNIFSGLSKHTFRLDVLQLSSLTCGVGRTRSMATAISELQIQHLQLPYPDVNRFKRVSEATVDSALNPHFSSKCIRKTGNCLNKREKREKAGKSARTMRSESWVHFRKARSPEFSRHLSPIKHEKHESKIRFS
jgi:hypothetical protein